ncbi:MAG: hypothetical protein BGP03_05290 [Pseudonocardia sp. 73-21]|nr:MAG: hypothetical protein BGP03_05290 [Pseudonocardia sp. 73-21]
MAGDVVAILLPVLVAAVVVAGVVAAVVAARRRRAWLLPAASALVMGVVTVTGPWLPADDGTVTPGAAVTVGAANVMGVGTPGAALLAARPDVLVVSEYTPALALDYPTARPGWAVPTSPSSAGSRSGGWRAPDRRCRGCGCRWTRPRVRSSSTACTCPGPG